MDFCIEDVDSGDLEECRANLVNAVDIARRSAEKVEAVLAIARTGREDVEWEDVALRALVLAIWDDLTGTCNDPAAPALKIDVPQDFCFHTERQAVSTILENLLSNALKYTDPNKQERWVSVHARAARNRAEIDVADNGPGFPESSRNKVFQMFHRLRTDSGSGLGLALVKKNVERLGGDITFESGSEGSLFAISIPLRAEG